MKIEFAAHFVKKNSHLRLKTSRKPPLIEPKTQNLANIRFQRQNKGVLRLHLMRQEMQIYKLLFD